MRIKRARDLAAARPSTPSALTTRPSPLNDAWIEALSSYRKARLSTKCPQKIRHLLDARGWIGAAGWQMSNLSNFERSAFVSPQADAHIINLIRRITTEALSCVRLT